MPERFFVTSSWSGGNGGNCVEAAAPEGFIFTKSSYSDPISGNCVEVGKQAAAGDILLRDSKIEESPLIGASPEAFTAFIGGIVVDEFAIARA